MEKTLGCTGSIAINNRCIQVCPYVILVRKMYDQLQYIITMVERENRDQKEKIPASGLSPFGYTLYRAFWIAALFSYIGAAMYDVAASSKSFIRFSYHNSKYSADLSFCFTIWGFI
jgi:hypothetical protein